MKLARYRQPVLACSLTGAMLACGAAFAEDGAGFYVGAGAGVGRPLAVGDNKSGPLPTLSAGYGFANGLRPEVEISYRYNSKNGLAEHAASAMGNLWYDFWQDGYYFYLGGGFGGTRLKASGDGLGGTDTLAAWQVGSGFGHTITDNLALGLNYRHLATFDKPKYDIQGQSFEGPHYMTNAILLELRYSFGGRFDNSATGSEEPVRVVPVR
ncbi:MAG: outer membrane beta-barrel protein [Nevskia sp.]|nr:outer membrane beta-barrel protein [Nevskia sp.]